jgi:uncharacterized protein YqgV (UPF0045/DUF77 family)
LTHDILEYWPIFAAIVGAFFTWTIILLTASIGTAKYINSLIISVNNKIGAQGTKLEGQFALVNANLMQQDAKRTELKEAILLEVRQRSHTLQGRMDMQHSSTDDKIDELKDKINELSNRITRVEASIESNGKQ